MLVFIKWIALTPKATKHFVDDAFNFKAILYCKGLWRLFLNLNTTNYILFKIITQCLTLLKFGNITSW